MMAFRSLDRSLFVHQLDWTNNIKNYQEFSWTKWRVQHNRFLSLFGSSELYSWSIVVIWSLRSTSRRVENVNTIWLPNKWGVGECCYEETVAVCQASVGSCFQDDDNQFVFASNVGELGCGRELCVTNIGGNSIRLEGIVFALQCVCTTEMCAGDMMKGYVFGLTCRFGSSSNKQWSMRGK